jgi:elongation factor Ts
VFQADTHYSYLLNHFIEEFMAISAALVKELRDRTGAGMMECKRALEETNGNIDVAIENMRKAGQAKADKKADRTAAEGLIIIATNAEMAAIAEINCETDFVARDENFRSFAQAVSEVALLHKTDDVAQLIESAMSNGTLLEEARKTLVAKIGENIQVRRAKLVNAEGCRIGQYSHGGRIGVLVKVKGGDDQLAKDIAMHIAASKPQFVRPDDVSPDVIAKEKEIFVAQAKESGKPDDIIEKMVQGRIRKFLDEICLLGQPFVKDPDQTIAQLLSQNKAEIQTFVRFEVGEGIEKKEVNFAEEVMAQVQGNS